MPDRNQRAQDRSEKEIFAAKMLMADKRFAEAATHLREDPEFKATFERLDLSRLSNAFDSFSEHILAYNEFHRMERRLWSVKLGKGQVPHDLEGLLRRKVPEGRSAYRTAFAGIADCLSAIEQSGFDRVLDRHLPAFTQLLGEANHPLRDIVDKYMSALGCSGQMLGEGHAMMEAAHHDVIATIGGGQFRGLREALDKAVAAQVEILDYTERDGLKYLRGRCGPPAWAVTVVQVLGYFGISVSAWWVVAAVTVVIALLITLCATESLPSDILSKCRYLSFKLKFSF